MAICYKLEKFEGPLDLLLHLIDRSKVDIYDIPIAEITRQYLDYVSHMEHEDLNVVSDFLVMAATLLDIKSRMLLPVDPVEEGEEEDPRAELVSRLLEYKKYKRMAGELVTLEEKTGGVVCRRPSLPAQVKRYEPPVDLDQLLDGLTLAKMQRIFDSVMRRREDRIDPIRSQFNQIRKESVSLETRIYDVMDYARRHSKFSFRQTLERQGDRVEIVVTFLAVLELMKLGKIALIQEELFDEIYIETLEKEGDETELDLTDLSGLEG